METGGSFGFLSPWGLFENALNSAPNMPTFIGAIIVVQVFLYVRDFIMRGQYKETDVGEEMAAPYGRVVVLHFGIFVGAGGLALLGNPALGHSRANRPASNLGRLHDRPPQKAFRWRLAQTKS